MKSIIAKSSILSLIMALVGCNGLQLTDNNNDNDNDVAQFAAHDNVKSMHSLHIR